MPSDFLESIILVLATSKGVVTQAANEPDTLPQRAASGHAARLSGRPFGERCTASIDFRYS